MQFPYEAYQCQVHTSPRNFSPILLNIQHDLGLFAFLFLVAHVRYLIDLQLDYMERVLQALQEVLSGLHHALIKVDSHRTALTLYTIHRKGPSCSIPGLAATVSRSAAGKECPVGEPYRHRKDVVPALCRPCLAGVPESQAGEPNAIIHLVSSNQFLSNRTLWLSSDDHHLGRQNWSCKVPSYQYDAQLRELLSYQHHMHPRELPLYHCDVWQAGKLLMGCMAWRAGSSPGSSADSHEERIWRGLAGISYTSIKMHQLFGFHLLN